MMVAIRSVRSHIIFSSDSIAPAVAADRLDMMGGHRVALDQDDQVVELRDAHEGDAIGLAYVVDRRELDGAPLQPVEGDRHAARYGPGGPDKFHRLFFFKQKTAYEI